MIRPSLTAALAAAIFLSAACSPALDWREFVPEGSDIRVTFPCRPDRQARPVMLAGAKVQMDMLVCATEGMTFAVAFADVADPTQVGPAVASLRQTAVANIRGEPPQASPFVLKGMTPNDHTGRLAFGGRLPDGAAVREQAAFFTRGLRVYQASVIGADPAPGAVESFLGGLKFPI